MTRPAPVLEGRLVTLRPFSDGFSPSELASLYEWARDPELLVLAGGVPIDMGFDAFCRAFEEQRHQRSSGASQWFAMLADHEAFVGRAGLYGMSAGRRRAEAGIVIGDRRYWDRGYGRDALATLVDYGFGSLLLDEIQLQTFPRNARARRAFQAVGFTVRREIERFSFERGTHRTLQMTLHRARWRRLRD